MAPKMAISWTREELVTLIELYERNKCFYEVVPIHYHNRIKKSVASSAGVDFEIKMITLLYLRLLDSGSEFFLGTNIAAARPFDDIVVKYRADSEQPWTTNLLQLKHKKSTLPLLNNDFSLVKDFDAAAHCEAEAEDEKFLGDFSGRQFIIFTNASLEDAIGKKEDVRPIFNAGGEAISFDEETQLYQQLLDWSEFKSVLVQLRDNARGKSDEEVSAQVREGLSGLPTFKSKHLKGVVQNSANIGTIEKLERMLTEIQALPEKKYRNEFLNKLQLYMRQAEGIQLDGQIKECLEKMCKFADASEKDAMFNALTRKVRLWCQQGTKFLTRDSSIWLDLIKGHIEKLSASEKQVTRIDFKDGSLDQLNRAMPWTSNGILNIIVASRTTASAMKARKVLARFGNKENFICVDLETLLLREDKVIAFWSSRWCRALVVECDIELSAKCAARLGRKIVEVVEGNTLGKMFVFIGRESNYLADALDNSDCYRYQRDSCRWTDLMESAHDDLLDIAVEFQGSKMFLRELVDEEGKFSTHVNGDVISQLLCGDTRCGKVLEPAGEIFIPRQLSAPKGVPFLVDSVSDVAGKVVLVVADAGMGKSTLINHLAHSAKAEDSANWVVNLKLNDCVQHLAEMDLEDFNGDAAKKMLERIVLTAENSLEIALFRSAEQKLIVFIDGIDDVCPQYEDQVLQFLKSVSNLNVMQLWIASRETMRQKLEACLEIRAYKLEPFSSKDLAYFFARTSAPYLGKSEKEIDGFVELLVNSKIKNGTQENPSWQTPRMASLIAYLIFEDLQAYFDGGVDLPEVSLATVSLDKMALYDHFMQKKCLENAKFPKNNVHLERRHKHFFHQNHLMAALYSLFSKDEISALQFKEKHSHEMFLQFLVEVRNGREKTGIIDGVSDDGIPHFVHRTFAEFFVASWLSKNIENNTEFVERITFSPSFAGASDMFNRILARGHPLHTAVLNRDEQEVNRLLLEDSTSVKFDCNSKDAGGRTAVHLAVLLSVTDRNLDILQLLLQHKARVDVADTVLGWRPLQYADRAHAWSAAGVILSNNGCEDDMTSITSIEPPARRYFIDFIKKSPTTEPDESLLLVVARNANDLQVVRYLVEERHGDVRCSDKQGATMLHMAAAGGNIVLMKYLCDLGLCHDDEDVKRSTPMNYAALLGHTDAVRFFLDAKRNAKRPSKYPAALAEKNTAASPSLIDANLKQEEPKRASKPFPFGAISEQQEPKPAAKVSMIDANLKPEEPKPAAKVSMIDANLKQEEPKRATSLSLIRLLSDKKEVKPAAKSSLIGANSDKQELCIIPTNPKKLQRQESYQKVPGAVFSTSDDYQSNMLTLVYLRMLAKKCEFKLASYMEEAGWFNDIVIWCRENSTVHWNIFCLQLQHQRRPSKDISKHVLLGLSGPYSLVRFCASFESIVLPHKNQIVLFTNASIDKDLVDEVKSDQLLNTGGQAVSFKTGGEVYRELCEWVDFKEALTELHGQVDGMSDKEVRSRVNHVLKSTVYQNKAVTSCKEDLLKSPSLRKLEEMLRKLELVSDKETYSSFLAELQVYTDQAHESELDAKIKEELGNVWIQSDSPDAKVMFYTLKYKVKTWWQKECVYLTQDSPLWLDVVKLQTEALSKSTIGGLTRMGAEFRDDTLKDLFDRISYVARGGGIWNLSVGSRTAESSLKVWQALARFGARDWNVVHVNVKALLAREDDVLSAWATRWCRVLVVECDDELDRKQATRISAKVLQVVARKTDKKLLVLIAQDKHELNLQLQHAESYSRFHDNFVWSDLTKKTQRRLLSSEVVLNGITSPQNLSELLTDDKGFVNKADLEVISQLLQGDLSCGKILESESKHFVTRRLQESADGVPFVVNSVRDVPGKVVLVVAEPGMGKTTLMTHLARSAKEEDPSTWVVHIKLNDCVQYLKDIEVEHFNEGTAKKFLEQSALSPENSLEKLLFETLKSKLTLFVDGVDEVCPQYEKEVFALLSCLKEMEISHLWVASRPIFQDKLESILGIKPHYLVAFSAEEQTGYFNDKFLERFPTASAKRCSLVTANLLAWLNDALGEDNPVLGVPLMNAMIAETFQDANLMFVETADSEFTKIYHLEVLILYTSFVRKKFDIYCVEEKKTASRELPAILNDGAKLLKHMYHTHRLAALRVLFSPEEISSLQFEGKDRFDSDLASFLQEVSDGSEKMGIVDNVIDGNPHFVHRSFAEFFAATWLAENFKTNTGLMERILFDPAYKLFSDMFHRSFAENHPLHVAVCSRDIGLFKNILMTKLRYLDVNELDEGGRTPLNLAVLLSGTDRHHDYTDIVKFLLQEYNARLDIADEVLGWIPLRYAEWTGAWETLHVILECIAKEGKGKASLHKILEGWPNPDTRVMLDAARDATVRVVRYLVEDRGGNFTCRGPEGESLIHRAAEGENVQVIKLLLSKRQYFLYFSERGLDLDAVNNQGLTALQVAAQKGMYMAMDALLEAKASYKLSPSTATEVQLNTSLLCAAFAGNLASVKHLVARGASARYQNSVGHTAILVANNRKHVEVIDWLLLRGLQDGYTPLHNACLQADLHLVSIILSRGADIESRGWRGETPLAAAVRGRHEDVVELLLEKGASLESYDEDGWTPLHHASESGNDHITATLLRYGADVMARDKKNRTALHVAASNGNIAMVTLLLEKGASMESRDKKGWTPLHHASAKGSDQVATLLLRHGADVMARDYEGQTPLNVAASSNNVAVMEFLLEKGASLESRDMKGWTPLHHASAKGSDQVATLLLRHGADVMANDNEGHTPLHMAASSNNVAVMEFLLEKGASLESRDKKGWTPLHHASAKGNDQVATLLLSHGADVMARDDEGHTPLHVAASSNNVDVMEFLLEKGASLESRDKKGWTPLHYASAKGNDQVATLLLRHGADVKARDDEGHNPLHVVVPSNNVAGMELLLNRKGARKRVGEKSLYRLGKAALHRDSSSGSDKVPPQMLSPVPDNVDGDLKGGTQLE